MKYDELKINDYYSDTVKRRIEKEERIPRNGKIYVSTVSSCQCDYQIRYIFEGRKKDRELKIWPGLENKIGDKIHEEMQKLLLENNFIVEAEKKISITIENVKINCRIDGVFIDNNVLEIKTVGPKDYGIKEPKIEHVYQCNFYIGLNGGKEGIISYFKRDSGLPLKSFTIKFDKVLYDNIISRITNIIKNKDLKFNIKNCRFCNYSEICKK